MAKKMKQTKEQILEGNCAMRISLVGLSVTSVCAILTLFLTILWVSLTTGEYLHQIKENDLSITDVQLRYGN